MWPFRCQTEHAWSSERVAIEKSPLEEPGRCWEPHPPAPTAHSPECPFLAAGVSPVVTSPPQTAPALVRGHRLLLVQMAVLLRKQLLCTCRTWKSTACDLLLPVLFVALAMGLFMVQPLTTDYPPLQMTPGHYERAEMYFFR